MKTNSTRTLVLKSGLALVLGMVGGASTALAHPYATCLTNSAGTVSFRLNEAADTVKITWNGGANSFTIGALAQGLTVTNLTGQGLGVGAFGVEVTKAGSGAPTLISDNNNANNQFYGPRAVAVNKRPASPYFGRIYVGNSPGKTGSGRPTGDGIYVLNADSSDALGQGTNALTAGINMVASSASMPWRIRVGTDDDMLYMCDWTDTSGNLFQADPNVSATSGTNVFMLPVGSMASPLDSSMNHGSVSEVIVTGSLAKGDLKVYTTDEDYETNPGFQTELNCLWRYDIGSGPFPWTAYPNQKVGDASVTFNASQVMGLDRGANGYFYLLDSRSTGNEYGLIVIDPAGPTVLWNSLTESQLLGSTTDLLNASVSVAVSPDMKYCAVMKSSGVVVLMALNNGIPDLAGRTQFTAIGTARQIAFDAADNVYTISASTERLRIYSLGLTTTATTTSDPTGSGGEGGAFGMMTPATTVSATKDTDTLYEAGPTTAVFTITRNNDPLTQPLTVQFSVAGTSTRGTDYVLQTNAVTLTNNSVVIPAGVATVNVSLIVTDDTTSEFAETATLNIAGTAFYSAQPPTSQTVTIVDNDAQMIDTAAPLNSVFEGLMNDYARFRFLRRGDTNVAVTANISYAGTAAAARYTGPTSVVFNPGDTNADFDISPVNDNLLQGDQTVICKVASGSGYAIGTNTPSATATIVDDELLPETVLWSENFDSDNSANWTLRYGSVNEVEDYRYAFGYDYSSGLAPVSGASMPALPPAPHSAGATTKGLYLTVNKDEGSSLGASGINLYPTGRTFAGNFAVRFDMYLMVGNAASTTEYALFGINHGGNATNWFRNSLGGITNGTYDGVFFGVEADAAALGDYVPYSRGAPGATGPLNLTDGVNASTLTGIFKVPPYGLAGGLAGAPGTWETTTNGWTHVEIDKVGSIVKLRMNNTQIMSFSNSTPYLSGNIMLGYCDAYDSIMAGNSCVIYDNVRVVSVDAPKIVPPSPTFTGIGGTNVVLSFTFGIDDLTSAFKVQRATAVNGAYADWANTTIIKTGPGRSTATATGARPAANAQGYYRIRYVP